MAEIGGATLCNLAGRFKRAARRRGSSGLPILIVAARLLVIDRAAVIAADALPGVLAALTLIVGLGSGIFGLLAAHDLIHCRRWALNMLGMPKLTAVGSRHFRTAAAILLALFPRLWRRRMDVLVEHWTCRVQGYAVPEAAERSARLVT